MTEPLDLDALQRLCDAATDAPWFRHDGGCGGVEVEDSHKRIVAEMLSSDGTHDHRRADAEFVAAARTAMPALIAEVRRLTGELAALARPDRHAEAWARRQAATGGGPCPTCTRPFWTHVCLSCSPDSQSPGPGCINCRDTGMDQTPCLPPSPAPDVERGA